jgi:hypothetical protein
MDVTKTQNSRIVQEFHSPCILTHDSLLGKQVRYRCVTPAGITMQIAFYIGWIIPYYLGSCKLPLPRIPASGLRSSTRQGRCLSPSTVI